MLNSISDNFAEAMKSNHSKVEYSKQFENIVKGVEESLKRQESNLQLKQQRVEEYKQVHQSVSVFRKSIQGMPNPWFVNLVGGRAAQVL